MMSSNIQIIDYTPNLQPHFKALNVAWITKFFKMETADYEALDHPDKKILNKGGVIIFAQQNEEIIGTVALIKVNESVYEMAKMAVDDKVKGLGIGFLLGKTILEKAQTLGAKIVFLESNRILKPALNLYQKLGFVEVPIDETPYARADIKMEIYY